MGSSNVSTNGLATGGMESGAWIEANFFCDDPDFVAKVLNFFEAIWEEWDTRKVTDADIQAAKEARKRWSILVDRPKATTLFAACREFPKNFSNVFVAGYIQSLSTKANARLRNMRARAKQPAHRLSESDFRNAQGYQFKNVPEGAWLIDLDCRLSKPSFKGCWKDTGLRLEVDGEDDLIIALRGVVEAPGFDAMLPISAAEKASLINNAERILNAKRVLEGEVLPLTEVINIIDGGK